MNDEFAVNELLASPEQEPAKKGKKAPKIVADEVIDQEQVDPNKGKIRIMIDEVAGMSNYETIGVNGNIIQIKRGVPVWVKPEYVGVLETAIMTNIERKLDPRTGETIEVVKNYSAVPWRRV